MTSPYHRPLRVGTRGSPLALAQARQVTGQLRERCGRAAVLITMATPGDGSAAPIEHLGTTGVFTTTLRAALLRGEVDLVVHSGKDLPTAPVAGLQVAAFPARADPRDALIAVIRAQVTGTAGEQLGRRLAHLLLARGGAALLGRTSHEVTDPLIPAARKDGPC